MKSLKLCSALLALLFILSAFVTVLAGCDLGETNSPSATTLPDPDPEDNCEHQYFAACDDSCNLCGKSRPNVPAHSFSSDSKCEDLTCKFCGYVLKQSHAYKIDEVLDSATLFTGGRQSLRCDTCGKETIQTLDKIAPDTLGMPVIYIEDFATNSIKLIDLEKADGEIPVKYTYVSSSDEIEDFEAYCKIKIQGSSSAKYPKKNFTVKLYEDKSLSSKLKVDLGWGKENKYCMKANYIDFSQARNVVAANLFAQVVQSRDNIDPRLLDTPNYGVIDGYPVLVYLNGRFHGTYTMNIPKDKWAYDMDDDETKREAAFMADTWDDSCFLRKEISSSLTGWEIEHCSTSDDSWVRESFNNFIRFLNNSDDATIKRDLHKYVDIEAAIDNLLFTYAISAFDNRAKNTLWLTYDGKVWIPTMYDMDGTFGIQWNGNAIVENFSDPNHAPLVPAKNKDGTYYYNSSLLHTVLSRCFREQVEARWAELRQSVLTEENVRIAFEEFFAKIDDIAYASDLDRWSDLPGPKENLCDYIVGYTARHLVRLDAFFTEINWLG